MRHGVYVLALEQGGIYVGRSADIDSRIQQHRSGLGSAWCRRQGGVVSEEPTVHAGSPDDLASWEMNETVAQMLIHGFENVRGWEFTNCAALTSKECDTLKTLVMGQGNMCRRCGGEGHFAQHCRREIQPWLRELERLQSESVVPVAPAPNVVNVIAKAAMAYRPTERKARQPRASPPAQSEPVPVPPATPAAESRRVRQRVVCERCGRDSHAAATCFAHRHFTGAELPLRGT
jgi:ribosomal protein L37E